MKVQFFAFSSVNAKSIGFTAFSGRRRKKEDNQCHDLKVAGSSSFVLVQPGSADNTFMFESKICHIF
jgi:hypothetical protein